MSYNPNVAYRGPDPATRSLTEEITAKFGPPPRPYEFVTGWKDPGNVSGHNPDSNGITHGVDIFLTPERNRWVADHLAARGRAGDPRVGYVIYAGQIAAPSTGYHFAGSGWEHWDHPHLSVSDGYWGGPCTAHPSIYNDTSSWGIATSGTTAPLSNNIERITEGFLMALSETDQQEILLNIRKLVKFNDGELSRDKADTIKIDEVVANVRKIVWNTTEAKALLQASPPADLAKALDAAGIASQVRDELAKLIGGK